MQSALLVWLQINGAKETRFTKAKLWVAKEFTVNQTWHMLLQVQKKCFRKSVNVKADEVSFEMEALLNIAYLSIKSDLNKITFHDKISSEQNAH